MKAIELERSDDRMSTQMRGGGPSHPEAAPSQSPRENDSSTKRADRGNTTVPRSTVVRREMTVTVVLNDVDSYDSYDRSLSIDRYRIAV